MTELDFLAKWEGEAARLGHLGALVHGATLCRDMLADFGRLREAAEAKPLSLKEAAAWSGYSEAHLIRLVKQGRLKTLRPLGSRGRLTFGRADLPKKAGAQHTRTTGAHELASRLGLRGKGGRDGRLH